MHIVKRFQLVSLLITLLVVVECYSLEFKEVTELTQSQRNTLKRFRNEVESFLPHSYMKEDLYLVRFLQSKNFRFRDSVIALKEAVQWRQQNKMDTIDSEDFSDIEQDFPLYLDGVDKEGRVIMEAHFGEWPFRTAVITGKFDKVKRYGIKAIEDATKKVRALQETQGTNVTQWVMLMNMDGFTIIESACPSCLPYYLNFVSSYEKYYPFTVGQAIFVNTPEAFETVLNLVRPIMNIQTRKALKVFGTNEKTWKPYLEQYFDKRQIADWFGGEKPRRKDH